MYRVFGYSDCGFCTRATKLLQERGLMFTYWPLEQDEGMKNVLQENHSWKTVPMIIYFDIDSHEETFIGGYTDLVEYLNDEEE